MKNNIIYPAQLSTQSFGQLQVNVNAILDSLPIAGATVDISYAGEPDRVIEQITTNDIGQTEKIDLTTPPLEYSLEPNIEQPYSVYNLLVHAPGYEDVEISGTELLPNVTALQGVEMSQLEEISGRLYVIPPHTLYYEYPPKIAEAEVKNVSETGEIVLDRVVIPEFIVVHDGPPTDTSAENYYVRFKDYIKNVASSEIYATWPESTIQANILAIQSFTLNRVFTEWYRNKGFPFTITSSTAFDHKWMVGRNIFDNISLTVDTIFSNYLSRPNIIQPILTQYCDGNRVQCPNWMTQWGSKNLGDDGYNAIEILRHFYGDNMFINTTEEIAGVPSSWPGANITIGTTSEKVRQLQEQLNVISNGYPLIPKVAVDGVFGENTSNSVKIFQEVFGLSATGIVDYPTWYRISDIYVAVSKIAEL